MRGTEGGFGPFFSPDGQWVGFFSDFKLKKVAIGGGATSTLCDVSSPSGASWGPDDTILFISMHQNPRTIYPGSGHEWEKGTGAGEGFTINIPFDPGAGDAEYHEALDWHVIPAIDHFQPEMMMVSAGFDAHREDPLAQIELSEDFFQQMTEQLVDAAVRHCNGKIVSTLEGGYNLRALGRSVVRHLRGLSKR